MVTGRDGGPFAYFNYMVHALVIMARAVAAQARILSLRLVAMHLLLLLFLAGPGAFATRTECEKALLAVQAALGENPRTEVYNDESRRTSKPTVALEKLIPGMHGGQLLILTKTGTRWLSDYRTVQYDPQGDPRWFIEVMGHEAAAFFGFKILADTRVQVPDGREFEGALKKINAQLSKMGVEPIEVSFYVNQGEGNTKVADYVRAFGESGGLPMASGGNHLIHDLSFHTGAIFLPGSLVRLGKYFARYLDGFLEFITRKYADDPARAAAVKHIAFLMRMNHTITIDTATGTVSAGIVAALRRPDQKDSFVMLYTPIDLMSGQGEIARSYFSGKLRALNPSEMLYAREFGGLASESKDGTHQSARTHAALSALGIPRLLEDLWEFSALKSVKGHEKLDWEHIPRDENVWESLCKGIGQRRLVIRQAALQLLTKK